MTLIFTKKIRLIVNYTGWVGTKMNWGVVPTRWGRIYSVSVGPFWMLCDVFDDYYLAVGLKDQ